MTFPFWPFFTRRKPPVRPVPIGPLYFARSVLIEVGKQAVRDRKKRSHIHEATKLLTTEILLSDLGRGA